MTLSLPENHIKPEGRNEDESTPLLPLSNPTLPSPLPPSQSTELNGYILIAISCLGFSGMSFLVHIAEDRYNFPATSSVFLRGIVHTVLSVLYIIFFLPFPQTLKDVSKKQWKLLVFRGLTGSFGMVFFFIALQRLPIGDAVTLFFCSPVLVMILSNIVLNEPITLLDTTAAITSFVGVTLVAHPDLGESITVSAHDRIIGAICGLTAAFLSSIAYVAIRSMGTRVNFMMSVFALGFSCIFTSTLLGGALGPADLGAQKTASILVLLSALFAFAGQCCITKGLQLCRAGPGILIRNLDVPIAYILGIFFLAESPTLLRLFGSTLVLASTLLIGIGQIVRS